MDFFAFLSTWFWYVMAFAAGALVAWLIARQFIRAESPQEAIEDAVDELLGNGNGNGDGDGDGDGGEDGVRGERHRHRPSRVARDEDERVESDEWIDEEEPRGARVAPSVGSRFAAWRRGATSLGGRR